MKNIFISVMNPFSMMFSFRTLGERGSGVYFSGDFCRHGKPFFLHRWVGITTTHHLTKTHTQKRLEVYDIEFLPPRQPFDLHLSFVPFKESGGGAVMQRILG